MKHRPIAFTAEMAQAIAEGRKTQTRRVITKLAKIGHITEFQPSDTRGYDWAFRDRRMLWNEVTTKRLLELCPYSIGERLYVQEPYTLTQFGKAVYKDATDQEGRRWTSFQPFDAEGEVRWLAPETMPQWAARSIIEITAIRVERLQDITEADARAEGAQAIAADNMPRIPLNLLQFVNQHMSRKFLTLGFWRIWNDLYGTDPVKGWDANPWVWVIEFRRVDA